ncbi:MAG: two-component system response regulator [Phycisphaerae bacterium]|nr:two-component system response regulator [Phycisphaerae bacterium]HAW96802.1 response regulator [Phycisphaerales bacterium]|tara:strand:- start:255 stop:635 length:381 start_codon:yes stop_codon:yes gene_type:complete
MRLERIRIMVVDDDPDIRELMTLALETEGAVVSQAVDGNDAINVFKVSAPELVVLDMMLPHRSGFLVLEHIQTSEDPPPVVMVTANEGRRHKAYAESLGVAAYLNKPVAMARLIDTVLEQLEARPT